MTGRRLFVSFFKKEGAHTDRAPYSIRYSVLVQVLYPSLWSESFLHTVSYFLFIDCTSIYIKIRETAVDVQIFRAVVLPAAAPRVRVCVLIVTHRRVCLVGLLDGRDESLGASREGAPALWRRWCARGGRHGCRSLRWRRICRRRQRLSAAAAAAAARPTRRCLFCWMEYRAHGGRLRSCGRRVQRRDVSLDRSVASGGNRRGAAATSHVAVVPPPPPAMTTLTTASLAPLAPAEAEQHQRQRSRRRWW